MRKGFKRIFPKTIFFFSMKKQFSFYTTCVYIKYICVSQLVHFFFWHSCSSATKQETGIVLWIYGNTVISEDIAPTMSAQVLVVVVVIVT